MQGSWQVDVYILLLADPIDAVGCLGFFCRVPVPLYMDDMVGPNHCQPHTGSHRGHDDDVEAHSCFKLLDHRFTGQRILFSLYCRSVSVDDVDVQTVNRSEEHTSELQSRENLVCRLLLEKRK